MGNRNRKTRSQSISGPWEPDPQQLEVYNAFVSGLKTQTEIAEELGVSVSAVSKTVRKIDAWMVPQCVDRIKVLRERQTVALDNIIYESMKAWEKSKRAKRTTTRDAEGGITRKTETSPGNPAYLGDAMKAMADQRKIWGVEAPIKTEAEVEYRVAGKGIDESRREMLDRLNEAKARIERGEE